METSISPPSHGTHVWKKIKRYLNATPRLPSKKGLPSPQTTPIIYISEDISQNMDCRIQANGHFTNSKLKSQVSKSDQEISRILAHQLELAQSDHANNIRQASSSAVIQQLRKSAPRLVGAQSHSSPCSPQHSRRTLMSNGAPHRSVSPNPRKFYMCEPGSSGSDQSVKSTRSLKTHQQRDRQDMYKHSLSGSPLRRSPNHLSPNSYHGTPPSTPQRVRGRSSRDFETSDLLKNARINLIWAFIVDSAKEFNLLREYHHMERMIWWKKLYHAVRAKHGKAKAASIAGQLMGNPAVLSALQKQLNSMVGESSGYIESLPKSVQRRIKALKKLQFESVKLEAEFCAAVHTLECKFADKYKPINEKRTKIIVGDYEPNEDDCDWPSDAESDDEEGGAKKIKEAEPLEPDTPTKGIESFWLTALKNAPLIGHMIQEDDEPILESLTDIKVQFSDQPMGFTLEFYFSSNEYFENTVLTKWYSMRCEPGEDDPLGFNGPEIVSCKGCDIKWNGDKDVTVTLAKKKQKNQKTGITRTVTTKVQNDSFFNFFKTLDVPEAGEEVDDDIKELIQTDFEIGHFLRERLIPHAILWFTGEENDDDDDEDDEDGDEEDFEDDDYDEDEDPDFDPSQVAQKPECKQQ